MLPFVPLGSRARVAAALAAAAACGAAAIAGIAACLTAPPADVGTSTNERPTIIHDAVYPPEGLIAQWPIDNRFLVPVQLPGPTSSCFWSDFDQDTELGTQQPLDINTQCTTSVMDGGVAVQDFQIKQPVDGHCHVFKFVVAHNFSAEGLPDSIGGDLVKWEYEPPNAFCNFYDAGPLQDGAFPQDAGSDGLLIPPESGPSDSGGTQ